MSDSGYQIQIPTSSDMLKFGAALAQTCRDLGAWIYLSGDLGMGKTTFAQGFLSGLNYKGRVKSPTYTLVEPYEVYGTTIYHIDLYRVTASMDLCSLSLEDYFTDTAICLIEWPDHFVHLLPIPDLFISFSHAPIKPLSEAPIRELSLTSKTARGELIIKNRLTPS